MVHSSTQSFAGVHHNTPHTARSTDCLLPEPFPEAATNGAHGQHQMQVDAHTVQEECPQPCRAPALLARGVTASMMPTSSSLAKRLGTSPVLRMLLMSSRKLSSFIWLSLNRNTVGCPALPACSGNTPWQQQDLVVQQDIWHLSLHNAHWGWHPRDPGSSLGPPPPRWGARFQP